MTMLLNFVVFIYFFCVQLIDLYILTSRMIINFFLQICPLFCACINPNPKYLQELLRVYDDLTIEDTQGNRLVHYAAACTSPGPLKLLIAKFVQLKIWKP